MTTIGEFSREALKGKPVQDAQFSRIFQVGRWLRQGSVLCYLCGIVIAASLLLGGGTRAGFLSDSILQIVALPLVLVALWKLFEVPVTKQMQIPLLFCLAIVIIPIIQLIPLPPWLWTDLPGRGPSAETFEILGQDTPWMPLSVVPHETWVSALSLISPLAIFLATLQLSYRDRRWLSWVFIAIGVVSVSIGMIQVFQGPESLWRFFEITNDTEAVGFFANRNHFSALLYASTLFAVAWVISAAVPWQTEPRRKYDTLLIVAIIGAFTLLVVLLAGQVMARSRMGLLLTIVALLAALALGVRDRRVAAHVTPIRLVLGSIVLVVVLAAQYSLYRFMERFAIDPLADARLPMGRNTIEAALAYLPFGSGLGTFVPVYAMFENPSDLYFNVYANHAHNDYLELWLNTGIVGLVLVGMFIAWFGLRAFEIWRDAPPSDATELDWDLARAATVIIGLLLVHSFVDYPLRTGGIMAVMAFACALLIEAPFGNEPVPAPERTPEAKKTPRPAEGGTFPTLQHEAVPVKKTPLPEMPMTMPPSGPVAPTPTPEAPKSSEHGLPADQRWGRDIEWPEEWSKKSSLPSQDGDQRKPKVLKPPKDS